jgi:hypothetical protein
MPVPRLCLVVSAATADPAIVTATVAGLLDLDDDLEVLVVGGAEPVTTVAGTGGRVGWLADPDDAAVAAAVSAPLWGLVAPGDAVGAAGLADRLRVMDEHPEVVIALCRASAGDGTGDAGPGWSQPLLPAPGLVDGRDLARVLLSAGSNVLGPPSAAILRRAAVLPGAGCVRPGAHLALWCEALARGRAFYDPRPGVEVGGAGPPDARGAFCPGSDPAPVWTALVCRAAELRLLDRRERRMALARQLVDVATQASSAAAAAVAAPDTAAGAAAVADTLRAVADAWAEPDGDGPVLDALVLADGNPLAAWATAEAVAAIAGRVVVADRAGSPRPEGCAAEWVTADWQDDASGEALAAEGARGLLVLAAGEEPDLVDEVQLRASLAGAGPGWAAEIEGPAGSEARVVWPGPGAGDRVGKPAPARLRSLLVRAMGEGRDWIPAPAPADGGPRTWRFVVAAPDYNERSGGIVALHRLCDRLAALGHDARIWPFDGGGRTNPDWRTPVDARPDLDGAVVVYPETVTGNPLGAPRVVRWLLNRPGRVNGRGMAEGPDDLVVAFNAAIAPLPVLGLPLIDPTVFFPKDNPGRGALLWIGRGTVPAGFDRTAVTALTGSWPATRRELATLLRGADVLYTGVWLSAINMEAVLCGTPVVVLDRGEWTEESVGRIPATPGVAWDATDLPAARARVHEAYPAYLEEIAAVHDRVGEFVTLVDRHFGARPGGPPVPAASASGATAPRQG